MTHSCALHAEQAVIVQRWSDSSEACPLSLTLHADILGGLWRCFQFELVAKKKTEVQTSGKRGKKGDVVAKSGSRLVDLQV